MQLRVTIQLARQTDADIAANGDATLDDRARADLSSPRNHGVQARRL